MSDRKTTALIVLFVAAFFAILVAVAGRPGTPQGIAPQVAAVRSAVVHVSKAGQCQGSGCLLTSDGILFTARHVTDGDPCAVYEITTDDGKQYKVKYVLEDREADLSYMKLDLPPGITTPSARLTLQNTLRVGDPVIIAGSPLGKDNINTFSLGILSAVDRDLYNRRGWEDCRSYQWRTMIQSTSPAFPGNSGGPVFNMRGEVIGVLVAGQAETLNFAVPVVRFRDNIDAVRQWFTLCRIRPLMPDMRGPRGYPGSQSTPADPNRGEDK